MANKSTAKKPSTKGKNTAGIDAAQEARANKAQDREEARLSLMHRFFRLPAEKGLSKGAKEVFDEERNRMAHRLNIVYGKGIDADKLPPAVKPSAKSEDK